MGGPSQRITPLCGSILQAGTCQILSFDENPRWSRVWQYDYYDIRLWEKHNAWSINVKKKLFLICLMKFLLAYSLNHRAEVTTRALYQSGRRNRDEHVIKFWCAVSPPCCLPVLRCTVAPNYSCAVPPPWLLELLFFPVRCPSTKCSWVPLPHLAMS